MRSQTIFADFGRIYSYSIDALGRMPAWPNNRKGVAKIFFGLNRHIPAPPGKKEP
jgi:hypothetical protein